MIPDMAQCISPIRLKKERGRFVDVPCGRCNFCLQNRRKEWSFRLQKELRQHTSAFFLTLTYDNQNVPFMETNSSLFSVSVPVPVLRKQDFQKFMKRLRKQHSRYSKLALKYYAVGEYGTKTARPHYHALVFGLEPKVAQKIDTIWGLGHVKVGTVTHDSIDYVTKYVINKYDFEDYPVPPFSCISKGIGLEHYNSNQKLYQNADTVVGGRGYKQVVPRYYKKRRPDKTKISKDIALRKAQLDAQQRESEELERLKRYYDDPVAGIRSRQVESHNRIGRSSKKGDLL